MFRKLFNPDNDLMIVMSWITDCIFLSLFWIIGCVPVITVGASTAALYDATFYAFRRHSKHSWGRFWQSYVKNLKSSIVPSILFLVIVFTGGSGVIRMWNQAVSTGNWTSFAAVATVGALVLGILSVLFPMLSRFENNFVQLVGNTARLTLAHLPRTIALAIVNGLVVFACVRMVIPVLVLPTLGAFVSTFFIEPMFKPYLPEDFYEAVSET